MHIGHQTDIIILDFAKAFDKVNHNKLIHKLKAHRVDMLTVLSRVDRSLSQQQITNSRSRWDLVRQRSSHIRTGSTTVLPQGSVLGPALFLL